MAYVMNPYSYKLGYSLSWSDDWFSNKKLYPVMLQIMLTIRYFLIFFWTSRNIEKLDTYLSHLNLTLNSGKLLITLFFYEAKMNQPEKYKYKVLKHIIHSIPYSDRNAEFKVNWKVKNSSVNVRAIRTTSAVKSYFFYENTLLETFESQRFFLFFYFLGLDPASFLLEFYSRYGDREYGEGSNKKPLKNVIVYKRFKSLGKKYSPKMFIYQLEFIFLNRIYKFLNEKVFFFWLYDKEKNLNMVRFLRTLFFYGGMAYFGKYYAPLMEEPGVFFSRFPEINNIKKSKKVTNYLNVVKKKKKNYNYFLQKLQIICYFSLLNLDYKEVLTNFKKNYKKHDLYNFLKFTLLNVKLKDTKKKNFFIDLKRRPTNKVFYKFWWKLSKKRAIKIQQVFAFRKAKIKLIEKYYSLYASHSYLYAQHGSTKFDSWGDFFLENKLRSYEFLIDSYGFSTDFKGNKLKINTLTRFYYYRIFYNIYGNFFWFFTGKELTFYINFSKNISRYVFLNKFYKELYKKFITNNLKTFKNYNKLNKHLNAIYLNYHKIDEYQTLKKLYKNAINDLLFLKRTVFWKFFENFWDFRKLYPKIVDKISKLIVHHSSYTPEDKKKLMLLENFLYWEPTSWKIFDFYRAIYCNFIKVRYLLGKYELVLNKYLKYKNFFFNYKRGFVKKFNLYNTKNKKNILLWKSKYWYKFKTYKESNQSKGEYIIFNRYYNHYIKKKSRTFLFLYNEGVFNLLEQNSVYIKDWFNTKLINNDKLYIQKNKSVEARNNFFYIKKHNLSDIKKNYCFVKKVNKDLKSTVNFIKFIENKKFYKHNKQNFNLFLKKNNYKNTTFLKKNYSYLLKYNILKQNNFFKFKKKLLSLNNNIKYLQKLNKSRRVKILLKFFKNWLYLVKAPKNESMLDDYRWYYFVFKARPKEFKWKWFKPFLRKKEKVNWKKLYIFFKYRVMNSSFDYKSLRKKIRNQEYSKKKTEMLIRKFSDLHPYRKKMLEKQKKYPRYGLKLYKYFSNYKRLAPLFKQKVLKRFSQQNINLRFVRFSYARLFFIFWFISLRSHRNIEPKEMFLNKYYNRTNLYDFGSLLFLYLLKKPFYDFFSYYIRSILKFWLNIAVDFNYIIITNDELSAQFIANHIARALHFGYKWREVVKPIRKDLKNLLTRLRVLEKRPRNNYFTKYENYENYENTMYEYSFIYIKLHIKNYLLSFKYFFKFKKINNFIKNFYHTFKFVSYFKFVEVPEVIDSFEEAVQKSKINNFKSNNKKKKFFNNNNTSNLPQINELPVFKKIIEANKNLVNNKINNNNIDILKKDNMERVDCIWSYTVFLNFFFKLKYFFFFFFIKLKKNFIYIRLNFINWFKSWKRNFLNYHTQLSNFLFLNFYKKIVNVYSINIYKQSLLHKKKFIFLFFFNFIKKKLYYKNLFFFNKNIDDIYKYFYFNSNTFEYKNYNNLKLTNNLNLNKKLNELYTFIISLTDVKNKLSINFKNYILTIVNIINKYSFDFISYFKINFFNSLINTSFLQNENVRINKIIKKNLYNYMKLLNASFGKFKIVYKQITLRAYKELLNKNNYFSQIKNNNNGYNSILYKKPKGWIYSYYNTIIVFIKNYLKNLKKNIFSILIYNMLNLIISIIKLLNVLKNFNNYLKQITLIKNLIIYFTKKNVLKLKNNNLIFIFKKINYYSFFKKYNISNNFIYVQLQLLLNDLFNKKILFFTQFKFIYERFFILNSINHWLNLPNLKISVLLNLKKFDWNLLKIVERSTVFNKNYLSKYSAFVKKKTFVDYFYQNRFLIGYKLRFAGRFKRRRKRTIMWLKKGLTPITAHDKWIDYGSHEIANEHSQYSVRIWLNKNKNVKYKHYLKF